MTNNTQGARVPRRSPDALRQLILQSARAEFAEHGYAGVTNQAIAERAGVATSVLYRHIPSKSELFAQAVVEPFLNGFERMSSDWLRQLGEPMSDDELMKVFLRDMMANLADHQHVLDQLLFGRSELPEDSISQIRAGFEKLLTQLSLMAELESRRRKWVRQEALGLAVRAIMGMLLGLSAFSWLLMPEGPDQTTTPEAIDAVANLTLRGLSGP